MHRRSKFVPRSGSKRSQEGFARDKPSETSRKEIKDASHHDVLRLRRSSPRTPPRLRSRVGGEGGGGGGEGGDGEGRREGGKGKEGSPFNYPTLNSLSG